MLEALRRNGFRGQHDGHLLDRPRRARGRARSLVEGDLLRGLGPRSRHSLLAGRTCRGRAVRPRHQPVRPQRDDAGRGRGAAAAALQRSEPDRSAQEPDGTPWEDVAFSELAMYAQRERPYDDVPHARRHRAADGPLQRVEAQLLPRHETAALQPGRRPGRDERPGRGPGPQLDQRRAYRARH